jgi:thermostable 8-oxoguanine DNA glycosylase
MKELKYGLGCVFIYYEKYAAKIINNYEYMLKVEDVLKKRKKKEHRILLKEIKGIMMDNTKLKKLNDA